MTDVKVKMSNLITIKNVLAVYTADASGKPLTVKRSGNGAAIQFLKRYSGKRVVVFIIEDKKCIE